MLTYPQIDPIAVHIGDWGIHWYGVMYLLGFFAFFMLGKYRATQQYWHAWDVKMLDDALFYGAVGVIVGGRVGYVLFYQWSYFLDHPLEIFALWHGGMSFHGGLVGVLLGMVYFAYRYQRSWLVTMDFVAPLVPIGLGAGRLGNFINAELWGRPTDLAWGMVFPNVDLWPRHPSQLYEFFLEGVLLWAVLWWYSSKQRPRGTISALFLVAYGSLRFAVEFTREPDSQLGLLELGLSMGQWLSLPMIIAGLTLAWYAHSKSVS